MDRHGPKWLVDAATGRLRTISAFGSQSIQDLAYTWDARGNLDSREDNRLSLREDFTYDALSRLKTATVAGGPTLSLTYDAVGNIQTKTYSNSAVAQNNYALTLLYNGPDGRLGEIQGDLAADVVYNANGEMTRYEDPATGAALMSVDWTAFNKPDEIVRNGEISTFRYAPDRSRYRHQYTEDGENIIRHYVEGVFEVVDRAGPTEYHHHILAAGEVVATHVRRDNGVHGTHWLLRDHLGSVDVVLDEAQQAVRTSFDAFGSRRDPDTWDGPAPPGSVIGGVRELTARGYTGHEMLDAVGLVHMNGRVYDPLVGRFLSPDPIVARPYSTQGWSRHTYVRNNPLRFVDPSGHSDEDAQTKKSQNGTKGSIFRTGFSGTTNVVFDYQQIRDAQAEGEVLRYSMFWENHQRGEQLRSAAPTGSFSIGGRRVLSAPADGDNVHGAAADAVAPSGGPGLVGQAMESQSDTSLSGSKTTWTGTAIARRPMSDATTAATTWTGGQHGQAQPRQHGQAQRTTWTGTNRQLGQARSQGHGPRHGPKCEEPKPMPVCGMTLCLPTDAASCSIRSADTLRPTAC